MSTPYIVNGAEGGVYPRLEIATLMQDEFQFSLFIQTMSRLQAEGYKPEAASWQEIGGIHGLPYARWVGDPKGPSEPEDTQGWEGYCYHASVLFPTWHRVLLILLEQAVCKEAQNVVSEISNSSGVSADELAKWTDAAKALRFPYWDWSDVKVQQQGIPQIFVTSSVQVRGPNNSKVTIDNPVMSYRFHPIPEGSTNEEIAGMQVDFADWKRTYRWATSGNNPQDNVQELNKALQDGVTIDGFAFTSDARIRQKLGRVFSFPATAPKNLWPTYWDYFSNTSPQSAAPPDVATIAPLEEPHNWVHLTVGGDGDMSFNELAGFDPIFYFHHCNVDRLYALWEYVYPDYWLGNGYYNRGKLTQFVDPQGTYQETAGTAISEGSPLPPFRKANSEYWVSSDVRGLQSGQGQNKCYSYPPLQLPLSSFQFSTARGSSSPQKVSSKTVVIDVTKPSTPEQRKEYIAALQQLYGDHTLVNKQLPVANPPLFTTAAIAMPPAATAPDATAVHASEAAVTSSAASAASSPAPAPTTTAVPDTHQPVNGFRDFVVTGDIPQFAFHGSHRLKLNLDGQHVDDISVFNRLDPSRCENCVSRIRNGNARVRGVMTLPHHHVVRLLEKHGKNTAHTTDDEVIDLLKKHISAHIVTPWGTNLAEASHGLSSSPADPGLPVFKQEDHPVLHLHSSRMFMAAPHHHLPHVHEGWAHHGAVLEGEWRRVHN